MTEKNYPDKMLPVFKKMDIGESVTYPVTKVNSIRSILNSYRYNKSAKNKRFSTLKVGAEIIVTREPDRAPTYE